MASASTNTGRTRPRSFSDAAQVSMQEAAEAEKRGEGAFATGYKVEAKETMRIRNSGHWRFLAAQLDVAIPNGGTSHSGIRRPDLVMQSTADGSVHMADIKVGKDMRASVAQLQDLSNVTSLPTDTGHVPVSSLTVITGTGSAHVDMDSLTQVALYSSDVATRRANALVRQENVGRLARGESALPEHPLATRLPLRVRSNSMDEGTSLPFAEFSQRRQQRLEAAKSVAPGKGFMPPLGGTS